MKLNSNIEVTGINQIVFDKTTIYTLDNKDGKYGGYWYRSTSSRNEKTDVGYFPNEVMARNLKGICRSNHYRVWIHEETINVYTIK